MQRLKDRTEALPLPVQNNKKKQKIAQTELPRRSHRSIAAPVHEQRGVMKGPSPEGHGRRSSRRHGSQTRAVGSCCSPRWIRLPHPSSPLPPPRARPRPHHNKGGEGAARPPPGPGPFSQHQLLPDARNTPRFSCLSPPLPLTLSPVLLSAGASRTDLSSRSRCSSTASLSALCCPPALPVPVGDCYAPPTEVGGETAYWPTYLRLIERRDGIGLTLPRSRLADCSANGSGDKGKKKKEQGEEGWNRVGGLTAALQNSVRHWLLQLSLSGRRALWGRLKGQSLCVA